MTLRVGGKSGHIPAPRPDPTFHHLRVRNLNGKGYSTFIELDGKEVHVSKAVVTFSVHDFVTVELTFPGTVEIDTEAEVKE
jgi:hypothetical protein